MRVSRGLAAVSVGLLLGACTPDGDGGTEPVGDPATSTGATAAAPTPSSPSPTPTPTGDRVLGAGTVQLGDAELPVSGDCDISKQFGERPVRGLGDEEVDVLLTVDNLTGDGRHAGDRPVVVRLEGSGAVEGRTLRVVTRDESDEELVRAGTVTRARLQDREQLDTLDVATLHLEARLPAEGSATSAGTLVLDVDCAITRPR